MRIGLYGLPTAGKSYILGAVRSLDVFSGSTLLKELSYNFDDLEDEDKTAVRKLLALQLRNNDNFIMDGHYSFGDKVVFTEEDGQLYDVFLYVYVNPSIISNRMASSSRNIKYLEYDIAQWQKSEVESLRKYCHDNNKDFYVLDNPCEGYFTDINIVLDFIDCIVAGYSCVGFAKEVADKIGLTAVISLIDGDRTFINEDSSKILGYKTNLFDGNFYSGFQAWRHNHEVEDYLKSVDNSYKPIEEMNITLNDNIQDHIEGKEVILTTGYYGLWKQIADKYNIQFFCGPQMCSDTKFFITKFLQERGTKVIAFGDSMNDYFMLKQANISFLVLKMDGKVSSSLDGRDLEGIRFV